MRFDYDCYHCGFSEEDRFANCWNRDLQFCPNCRHQLIRRFRPQSLTVQVPVSFHTLTSDIVPEKGSSDYKYWDGSGVKRVQSVYTSERVGARYARGEI